jgi:hypothetical protein
MHRKVFPGWSGGVGIERKLRLENLRLDGGTVLIFVTRK